MCRMTRSCCIAFVFVSFSAFTATSLGQNELSDLQVKLIVLTNSDEYWRQFGSSHEPIADMWQVLDRNEEYAI